MVFDLGGVLLAFDHMEICRRLSAHCPHAPEEVYRRVFTSGLEGRFDLGMDPGEFMSEGMRAIDAAPSLSPGRFRRIWSEIFTEMKEVTRLLPSLKSRTRLFLLSNTNELHWGYAARRFPFIEKSFEKVFLSFRLGVRKPDPGIFEAVIRETGLEPGRLFYVDDREEHVEAARASGMTAHLFRTPEGLAGALEALGL